MPKATLPPDPNLIRRHVRTVRRWLDGVLNTIQKAADSGSPRAAAWLAKFYGEVKPPRRWKARQPKARKRQS